MKKIGVKKNYFIINGGKENEFRKKNKKKTGI